MKADNWSLVDTKAKQKAFFEDPRNWRQWISLDLYEGVMLEVFDHYGLTVADLSIAVAHPNSRIAVLRERQFRHIEYAFINKLDPLTFAGTATKYDVLMTFRDIVKAHKEKEKTDEH